MLTRSNHFVALLDELARMRGRTVGVFRGMNLALGLSEIESVVLSAVVGAARPPTVPQIGRSLGHARQVIQRASDTLAARGLIVSEDNPDHRRARLLAPTKAGRTLKQVADTEGLVLAEAMTDGLDTALIERVVADLHAIRVAIEGNLRRTAKTGEEDE